MNPPTEPLIETSSTIAETFCGRCGGVIRYEPIMVAGKDLARVLYAFCEPCQAAESEAWRQRELAQARAERRALIFATIPPELLPAAYDPDGTNINHPEFPSKQWEVIKCWRPTARGNWLALIGPAGLGKTRILGLMAVKIMEQGIRLKWTTATRIHAEAENLKTGDHKIKAAAREYLHDCQHVAWLIIDDLGKNEWSAAFETQFFQILDHRKNYRLPLAYSSNADPSQFHLNISKLNAEPIIGRLVDRATPFYFEGRDLL